MKVHSYSSLSTFKHCPLKYKYRYIDKIKPEIEFIEAFMGKCLHKMLEIFYDRSIGGDGIFELDDYLCYLDYIWRCGSRLIIRYAREGQSTKQYQEIGERCITNYFNQYAPFDKWRTLGVEMKVELPYLNGDNSIVAYIDRLSYSPHTHGKVLEIHDYKTSKHLPSKKELKKDWQLSLYQVGVEWMFPDAERIELVWHYLYHDKEFRLTRNREELNQVMDRVLYLIDRIEIGQFKGFEPRAGFLCKWCPYQHLCPKRRDLILPEDLPPSMCKKG